MNEQQEKGVEFIENGLYNLKQLDKLPTLLPMAIEQIENGLKLVNEEEK